MQLERGRLEAGFIAFNHGDFDIDDFRVARAYATNKRFEFTHFDPTKALSFSINPNRDRDLHIANNVVSQAIAKAMQ